MTTEVDITNGALQVLGTRTTVTQSEYDNQTSNEAKQARLAITPLRDALLRMAPWDCAVDTQVLSWITAANGTPENQSPAPTAWSKGLPPPPWAYEYQYPVDCMRALWVLPTETTQGFPGVPITTAVTGGAPSLLPFAPIIYKAQIDQFIPVTAATVANGGTGHAVGDVITLARGAANANPIGAPAQLLVTAAPAGVISTVSVVNQISGASPSQGGSYFAAQANPVAQGSTTGNGTGATFNLTFGTKGSQRVILTNQPTAALAYLKQVTDPNVMDPLFIDAWKHILAARMCMGLNGKREQANDAIKLANLRIAEARTADGNEGLTINNVTPDWIRVRGWADPRMISGPFNSVDWGPFWPLY